MLLTSLLVAFCNASNQPNTVIGTIVKNPGGGFVATATPYGGPTSIGFGTTKGGAAMSAIGQMKK